MYVVVFLYGWRTRTVCVFVCVELIRCMYCRCRVRKSDRLFCLSLACVLQLESTQPIPAYVIDHFKEESPDTIHAVLALFTRYHRLTEVILSSCMYVCMYACIYVFMYVTLDMAKAWLMREISVTYFVFILYICVWVYWGDGNNFISACRYVCMYVCMYQPYYWLNVYQHCML